MHQALYRKWRPRRFDEVCGQEHVTDILRYETANGLISHAYLFCGSRGTGKTTCAKILAKAVNCENPQNGNPCCECAACRSIADGSASDVLEMDAASNNRVDDIRTILDEVIYTPGILKYRVYIIDEVHMLSVSAFNALLKTLEEPPAHVIFILATTELQKLPATVISRCQRFDFRRIGTQVLTSRLKFIAKEENIGLDDDAALIIARFAQGGMRDAISLFELCAAGGRVTAERVYEAVGIGGRERLSDCYINTSGNQSRKVVYRFDASYQITEEQTYNSDNKLIVRVIYKYDASGNIIKTTTYNVAEKFGTTVNELAGIAEYLWGTSTKPAGAAPASAPAAAPRSTSMSDAK